MRDWGAQSQRLIGRNPKLVTLRRFTRTLGPNPSVNPMGTSVLTVISAVGGDSHLDAQGDDLQGMLLAGDKLVIGGTTYKVQAKVESDLTGQLLAIVIEPPLAQDYPPDTTVAIIYAADLTVQAAVNGYVRSQQDGDADLVQTNMLLVAISRPALGDQEPTTEWKIVIDGVERTIGTVRPDWAASVAQWVLEAM